MTAAPSDLDRPVPREAVLAIAPYVPGRSHGAGGETLHKLSSNETPLGPSPAAVAAYKAAADSLELYPDPTARELRLAIGRRYGLDPDRIVCGAGSDELIALLARAYLDHGDEIVQTRHGFLIYSIAAQAAGAKTVFAPEPELVADVDAILAAVTERTRLVFVANPNNPTGTYIPYAEMKRLADALPPRVMLVIDAAYAEYVRRNDYSSGLELAGARENVCTLRTFSKAYGLAALRIGWLYGPASVIDAMHRVRGPFNLSTPAIAAGAAAIADTAHVEAAVAHNERWLPWLTAALEELGLKVTPSVGNFVLVHLPGGPGRTAAEADEHLVARGIIARRVGAYGLPEALRITVGSEAANRAVAAAFAEFLGVER